MRPVRPNDKRTSGLSAAQVQTLLSQVRQRADRARREGTTRAVVDEIVILILLRAGLRAQEACALRIADTPAHHGRPELHVCDLSGTTTRVVLLPLELVPVFQRFVRGHRKGARPSEPLLLSERGTPFSYMSLYSKVRRIGQESGITVLHPALLRHAFLVQLYDEQQDLRFVQEQAGHAHVKSTARHIRPHRVARRCDACGKPVATGRAETIDSGQLLCSRCLRDLRSH